MNKYKTIDLCAGIGGIRRGFELTERFENVLSAEIDPNACKTYEKLFNENPHNDLTSEEFKKKVVDTPYDILLAGFPCQSFSRVGKQLGFRDTTRGTIFFDIADIISRTNPQAIFLENVENLVNHDKGETIERIIKTLEDELNYKVIGVTLNDDGSYCYSAKSFVRNTRFFGLPQNRPRAYIMAFSRIWFGDSVDQLIEGLPTSCSKIVYNSLLDVLDDSVAEKYYLSSGYWETLKKHKERQEKKGYGFGYCIVNQREKDHPYANTILATGGSGKERNIIYQPNSSYEGMIVKNKRSPLNCEGVRFMTPSEWGKLQGFIGYAFKNKEGIDSFSFPEDLTDDQKYKQLGNSVSIPVIESMAHFMLHCLYKLKHLQNKQIIKLVIDNKFVTKQIIIKDLKITPLRAQYLLHKLVINNQLETIKRGRNAYYCLKAQNEIDSINEIEKC